MGEILDTSAQKRLLLRLDEFSIGGVTPAALESVVGTSSLRIVVDMYARGKHLFKREFILTLTLDL